MNVQDFKEKLFSEGKSIGFSDMELYYQKSDIFNCELFKGEVEKFTTSEEMGVSFRGLYNGKMGYAYTEKLDGESVYFLLENAKENSLIIEDAEPEEIFSGSERYENVNFYSETLSKISNEEKIDFMKKVDKEIYAQDERVVGTDFFILESAEVESALFNSKGLELLDRKNYLVFAVYVIVKENDVVKTAGHFEVVQNLDELDAGKIASTAVEEALSYLNPMSIPSKEYPVLLRNDTAASLISTFTPIFSAENAQQGMSQLKGKEGEQIAGENVCLIDDPFRKDGMFSRIFDAEGVASSKVSIIKNGKLNTLFHNLKTAKKAGVETTGHAFKNSYKGSVTVAPSNLYVQPGIKSYEMLVGEMKEGVIITELSGLHSGTNQISGDFSVAATGYYVKDGRIQSAANQMTIAGNFFELLNQIEEIGSDLKFSFGVPGSGYVGSPTLLVSGLSVTVE
ncbi:TldD/PmbA family protein [Bacillus carboniphilus]|uniref:TldD/PmbA family protein n=1 Tax=Bacillus carboniphilus TaxID=86663 RepID=A0ABN0W912_9BACI